MNIIFAHKGIYASVLALFLYIIGMIPSLARERNIMMVLGYAATFVILIGLLLKGVSRKNLLQSFLVLYCVINFSDCLPKYGWIVKSITAIKGMPAHVILCTLFMISYALLLILECIERNRRDDWNESINHDDMGENSRPRRSERRVITPSRFKDYELY